MRIYRTHHVLTPVGHIRHQNFSHASTAFCVEAICGVSLQLRWLKQPSIERRNAPFWAHVHFFGKKELLLLMQEQEILPSCNAVDKPQKGQDSWLSWHKIQNPSLGDLKIIGQYCLEYGQGEGEENSPQPREILKSGLGLESMAKALVFSEAKTPNEHDEVAKLRFNAFKRSKGLLPNQSSAEDMLDTWDKTEDGAVTFTAVMRNKLIGTIRLAFAQGRNGSLPLLQYFPHAKDFLPPLHLCAELSRKAGDPRFYWGDTSLAFLRQAILTCFTRQRRYIVACVRANEQKGLAQLGFAPTGFSCQYPCSPPIKSVILMIDVHALWLGKQGNTYLWKALFGDIVKQIPKQCYPRPNTLDRLRLTLLRTMTAVQRNSGNLRAQQTSQAMPFHQILLEKTKTLTYLNLR